MSKNQPSSFPIELTGDNTDDRKHKGREPLSSRVLMITDICSPYLLEYAASRGIPEHIIFRYCKNVILRGRTYGRTYDHLGFPNNAGGFALKAPSGFKCTTKGCYTTIDMAGNFTETPMSDTVTVFEGFFDFLSWLAKDNLEFPSTDVCVLNSVTNTTIAVPYLRQHKTLICCLDNDEAGRGALETLRSLRKDLRNPVILDGSLFYYGYKDVNEWWVAMNQQ